MKLGLVSAILDGWNFEEMIDTVSEMGFACVEVACWPQGKAERRYAGVSHIDVSEMTDEKAAYILDYCKQKNVEISALAFYPNTMDGNLKKRQENIAHLKKVIEASAQLGVNMVTTFIGRDHRVCGGEKGEDSHRKLSDAVRKRPVARRTESDDDPRHLAEAVWDHRFGVFRVEL